MQDALWILLATFKAASDEEVSEESRAVRAFPPILHAADHTKQTQSRKQAIPRHSLGILCAYLFAEIKYNFLHSER